MSKAETEIAHNEKIRQYQLAEKYLERSAQLYEKAGYTGKRDETLKALAKVKEKRRLKDYLTSGIRITLKNAKQSPDFVKYCYVAGIFEFLLNLLAALCNHAKRCFGSLDV
jgi:hypothetical protein